MMNCLLKDLIDEGHLVVYIDDILIFTDTLEENKRITKRVLEVLMNNDLYLKPEKCFFGKTSVEFLGLILGNGSMKMDTTKTDTITAWPVPKTVKDVCKFTGFANFYRCFIEGFSKIATLLNKLLCKDQK